MPATQPTISEPDTVRFHRLLLPGILLFSLACRLILIRYKEVVGTDEVIYLALGRNLWHGLGFQLQGYPVSICPPLLPIVAGIFSRFTENLELGTNFVYVVLGTCQIIPYFFLSLRIYGMRTARRSAFLLSFYPGLLLAFYWGSMTEALYTFVLLSALFFLYRGMEEERAEDFSLAGVFLALVYLCRSEGVLFFPVFLLFFLVLYAKNRTLFQKKALRNLSLMILCFVLVSAPYPLFLKKHTGDLSISGKTKLILLAGAMPLEQRERLLGKLNQDGTSFFDYAELVKDKTVLGMILENPKVLLGGSLLQLKNFVVTLFSWKVFPGFLAGFAILGLFFAPGGRRFRAREGFLLATCLPFLVFLTFRIWPRYLLPATPALLLWTARGAVVLEDWIRERTLRMNSFSGSFRRGLQILPMGIIIVPLLAILVAKPIKATMLSQYPVEFKTAGRWIASNLPPDASILTRKPEVAYYARRRMHPLPNEDLPAILQYARIHGVGYLVVDEFFIATRPQLKFLLRDEKIPEDLVLLHESVAPNGRRIRIFGIRGGNQERPSKESWIGGPGNGSSP